MAYAAWTQRGFIAALREEPAVIDAVHLTGPVDYEVRVRCRDTGDLDRLLTTWKADLGVASSHTRIVLNRVAGHDMGRSAAPMG